MKKLCLLGIAFLSLALFSACGGGSSSNGLDGEVWNAGDLMFVSESGAWSQLMTDFTIHIDPADNRVMAHCGDDEHADSYWWQWGPAQYAADGNRITAQNIPEVEGGDSVRLSVDLERASASRLRGTLTIDWPTANDARTSAVIDIQN